MKSISLLSGYLFLVLAIITGVAANGYLKTTAGFTKINPTIFCITSIIVCMFCLSKAMSVIPVGFTYATYGALTITAVTLFGNSYIIDNLSSLMKILTILGGAFVLSISTKYLKRASGGPIFLNFGRDYPNQQMTGLIWFGRFSEYFSYKPEKFLRRKSVCVKGYISEHEGKTQMEIRTEQQIKIQN